MRGLYKYTTRVLCLIVMGFGLYMVPPGVRLELKCRTKASLRVFG